MENLNAEQVKKGLERCANEWHCGLCGFTEKECALIKKSALALINSQEQRIKELAEENERLRVVADMSDTTLTDALRIVNEFCDARVKRARADTVRKMQERLKKQRFSDASPHDYELLHCFIDGVAEEMLEGDNGIQDK